MKAKPVRTYLRPDLIEWIESESKRQRRTKRAIIEQALDTARTIDVHEAAQ